MSKPRTGGCWCGRPPALAGLIEVRGLGIRRVPYEPVAVVGFLVELGAQDAERCLLAAERRPFWRELRCRGLRSQRVPTPCPWCWPIC